MPAPAFSSSTIVVRNSGFIDAEIDKEIVALSVEKGVCYGLDPIGSRIWHLLANPIRVADICNALVSEYQVDPEACEREVLDLLEELRAEGMIGALAETGPEGTAKGRI